VTRFQRLTLATAIATFLLVLLGGTTRVTNSGLSCPDWPTCFGRWVPTQNYHVLLEYNHRLLAGLVSWMLVAQTLAAWIWFRKDRALLWLTSLSILVLIVQIGLGGATVTQKLNAKIVSAHLGTAMILFAMVTLVACHAWSRTHTLVRPARNAAWLRNAGSFRVAAFTAAAGMYALLISGAYVASAGAGTSCGTSWPVCGGSAVPQSNWTHFVYENYTHRLIVALVTVAMLVLVWGARRWLHENPGLQKAVWAAAALFGAQILVGAANVMSKLLTPIQVLHLGVGSLMWCSLIVIAWMAYHAAQPVASPDASTLPAAPAQRQAQQPATPRREPQEVSR
jgi:heme A synthase